MFNGISCLFCVNYGHSVRRALQGVRVRASQASPAHEGKTDTGAEGNEAENSSKEACVQDSSTSVTALVVYSSQIHIEPRFSLGNGDFDLDVWNCWVYAAR
jgi:hypothetical protein